MSDIRALVRQQRAVLRSALERLASFNSSAELARRDVDEADRLADLIERRAEEEHSRPRYHEFPK